MAVASILSELVCAQDGYGGIVVVIMSCLNYRLAIANVRYALSESFPDPKQQEAMRMAGVRAANDAILAEKASRQRKRVAWMRGDEVFRVGPRAAAGQAPATSRSGAGQGKEGATTRPAATGDRAEQMANNNRWASKCKRLLQSMNPRPPPHCALFVTEGDLGPVSGRNVRQRLK